MTSSSFVKILAIDSQKIPKSRTMTDVTMTSKMTAMLANFLARSILPSPKQLPVRAEAAQLIPSGIMKINVIILTITTSVASYVTPRSPEKIVRISKIHHSQQSISMFGIPILRQTLTSLKTLMSQNLIMCFKSSSSQYFLQRITISAITMFRIQVMFVAIAAPFSLPSYTLMNK